VDPAGHVEARHSPKEEPDTRVEKWRVTVEEWERLVGGPEDLAEPDAPGVLEQRLIYTDEILL
jgi:hypothetical protein